MSKWLEHFAYQGRPKGFDGPVSTSCIVGVEADDGFGQAVRRLSNPMTRAEAETLLGKDGMPADIGSIINAELADEVARLQAELAETRAARDAWQEEAERLAAQPPPLEPAA